MSHSPRAGAWVLLGALGMGVLLVGVELMVTAVALPTIIADLGGWARLREASWIVNGYLVAYVAVMPLAGRAADRFSLAALYGASLAAFAVGSMLCGAAQSLEWLIGARVLQGLGAGAIFPLATAAAGHLFEGHSRARAIGVIGAFSFVGMAAGPVIGAAVLSLQVPAGVLTAPSWRWIFYLPAPLAVLSGLYLWAAGRALPHQATPGRLDVIGAALFTSGLALSLVALTVIGAPDVPHPLLLAAAAVTLLVLALVRFRTAREPFISLGLFRDRTFSGAVLMSLLTGYSLATAIIGAAVFVDRVRYAGPAEQQLTLGALAGAMAIGALGAGFIVRPMGVMVPSVAGLLAEIGGLLVLAQSMPQTDLATLCAALALFGLGFGVTVTARTTGALEALGRRAFGVGSAALTVARMIGMGIGLAALTVLGSNRIEALSVVLTDQGARDAVLPPQLQGRPLEDYLVVDALERWASGEAASILAWTFVVAAVVTAVAILPTLAMRNRPGVHAHTAQEEDVGNVVEEASRAGLAI
ncbi:MAG TPA: MFS transporter [Candidatus Limnocylindria bacterium]|nr:MFS transporter [Candidatus Limnocylindria bacterium]